MTTKNATATKTEILAGAVTSRVFVLQTYDENGEPHNYLTSCDDTAGEIWTYATREHAEAAKKLYDESASQDIEDYVPSVVHEMFLYQYPA